LGKTSALRFENVKFFKKPALYALKTLNFKLTLPSLAYHSATAPHLHEEWKNFFHIYTSFLPNSLLA
jgi:hypothetical protein